MFTAMTKINGSTMDVELQVLSRFFSWGGGYIRCIMGNVKMVNLKISRVEEIQYQIDTIQFIALKSAS